MKTKNFSKTLLKIYVEKDHGPIYSSPTIGLSNQFRFYYHFFYWYL